MTIETLRRTQGLLVAAALAFAVGAVSAQPMPDAENGRYALSPIADGVLRLEPPGLELSVADLFGPFEG